VKGLFAILLSLLPIATQTAFAAQNNLPAHTQNKTGAHHCCKTGQECHKRCCVIEEVPNSNPAPIAPTRSVSQTDSSLVSATVETDAHFFQDIRLTLMAARPYPSWK
jgi:hypothetical protein